MKLALLSLLTSFALSNSASSPGWLLSSTSVYRSTTASSFNQNSATDSIERCYRALVGANKIAQIVHKSVSKYNITSEAGIEATCCAMYDLINQAQLDSCSICQPHDLRSFTAYRLLSIKTMTNTVCSKIPYANWNKHCVDPHALDPTFLQRLPLNFHCANEPGLHTPKDFSISSSQKSNPTWSYILLYFLACLLSAVLIFLAVGIFFWYCNSGKISKFNKSSNSKAVKQQKQRDNSKQNSVNKSASRRGQKSLARNTLSRSKTTVVPKLYKVSTSSKSSIGPDGSQKRTT